MAQSGAREINQISKTEYRFGRWMIFYDPPPIPCRNSDWHFYHDNYDGAPDANDMRAGHAESVEGCLREIGEIEEWEDAADIVRAVISRPDTTASPDLVEAAKALLSDIADHPNAQRHLSGAKIMALGDAIAALAKAGAA